MKPETFSVAQAAETTNSLPGISIILPFEPKMAVKKDLEYRLQLAAEKAGKELAKNYAPEQYGPLLEKLKALIKKLDYSTYMQSIALFVSPAAEKLYYFNIPVEEKIEAAPSLDLRSLVAGKKDQQRYLVLSLAGSHSQVFLVDPAHFIRIASYRPRHAAAGRHEMPERVANFTDPQDKKEIMLEKFLRYVDDGLGILLKAYSLPLFVLGPERTVGHFKKISHHARQAGGYVHGNFEEAGEQLVRKAIAPLVDDWKQVKQQALLQRLDAAAGAQRLASGIAHAGREAAEKKGRLLLVEKGYGSPAVDNAIEAVLAGGGDVELMDDGLLKDHGRIALIKYY